MGGVVEIGEKKKDKVKRVKAEGCFRSRAGISQSGKLITRERK